MAYLKEAFECSVEELHRELIARGTQVPEARRFDFSDKNGTPQRDCIMTRVKKYYRDNAETLKPDESLTHISTEELVKVLLFRTGRIEIGGVRGNWGGDDRVDICDLSDDNVIKNASCVTAICNAVDLNDTNDGYFELRHKNYGKTYDLCGCEPFYYQPVAAGYMSSGFLVKEDMIATAGHCVARNIENLRFLFGFRMSDPSTPVTRVPKKNIYKAVEVVEKRYTTRGTNGTDWALVKLDRKVEDRPVVELCMTDVAYDQSIYVIGHPAGLPLKFAPGSRIKQLHPANFIADLDIYSGNSGSPVFDADSHKVVGIVIQGDDRDFYTWTGKCYVSVVYPRTDMKSEGSRCIKISEFSRYCFNNSPEGKD
jgi:hypothetical protein